MPRDGSQANDGCIDRHQLGHLHELIGHVVTFVIPLKELTNPHQTTDQRTREGSGKVCGVRHRVKAPPAIAPPPAPLPLQAGPLFPDRITIRLLTKIDVGGAS